MSWVGTVALLASVMTLSGAGAGPAGAAGPPQCTDPGLVSGTADNGDGTTSTVVVGSSGAGTATATVTVSVPVGVREVVLDACGGEGGAAIGAVSPPGLGGRATGTFELPSLAGAELTVLAGQQGYAGAYGARRPPASGFGGPASYFGGGGGGLSGVFTSADVDRAGVLVVAGGGGGAGGQDRQGAADTSGGSGGGERGGPGSGAAGGGGGSQTGPGAGGEAGEGGTDGRPGHGYSGGAGGYSSYGGGGGGGGWYGAGGGGETSQLQPSGGGGGSGHLSARVRAASTSSGVNGGNGVVVLTWTTPPTPHCTDAALVPGTRDNGDGTTSTVLLGEDGSATATATLDVPPGVDHVVVDACGAQGQDGEQFADPDLVPEGGRGGRSTGLLTLGAADGRTLTVIAGSRDGSAGFGGPASTTVNTGGSGGGLSGVFVGHSVTRAAAVLLAGGGGGGGAGGAAPRDGAGDGGGTAGRTGSATPNGGEPGGPGTQQGPGAGGAGESNGYDGEAGDGFSGGRGGGYPQGYASGGGGGGGWYGGGGGGGSDQLMWSPSVGPVVGGGGGGGGSGHLSDRVLQGATSAGQREGQGAVVLTWVTPVPPSFSTAPSAVGVLGEPFARSGDVGPAVPVATITAAGLPPGLTLTDNGDNSYRISGTPARVGTFIVTLTASSRAGSDRITGSIRVDRVPELVGTFSEGQVASAYSSSIDVPAAPAASVTVSGGSLPPGLVLDQPAPGEVRLHGTPQTAGTYVFTLRAVNEAGGRTRVVTREFAVRIGPAPPPAPAPAVPSPSATPAASASPSASPSPGPVGPVVVTARGRFHPVDPTRILDTRTGSVLHAGAERVVRVNGTGGVPATGVSAVVLNVTVTGPSRTADLQVFPRGQRPDRRTSNLNVRPGETVPVQVTTGLGPDGHIVLSLSAGAAHVVVDVFGWYGSDADPVAGSSGFTALSPRRLLDTRSQVAPVRAGQDRVVPVAGRAGVPPDATAVVLNATVLGTPGNADLQLYPAGRAPERRTSNLNVRRGQTRANAVTTALGRDGAIAVSVSQAQASVVLDVLGFYSPASSGRFVPVTPERLVDSRLRPWSLQQDAEHHEVVGGRGGLPTEAQAALLGVTATGATAPADLQVFPTGDRPARRTSTLNLHVGQTVANAAYAALGSGGQVGLSLSQGSSHVLLDVYGYFTHD